jgi:acetolactate synthase-1/2/3 large subunit
LELLRRLGAPLVGPSANPSGRISPTTAAHVREAFPTLLVLDGGVCRGGIESTVVSLVGDGGFGQNPSVLYTAREKGIAAIWVVMNNNAFGTIAGLEKAHYDTTYGTVFENAEGPVETDFAAIATAYGVTGIRVDSAAEFKPALERAIALDAPVVIDVRMVNVPTPTAGHWNIMDIYSPGKSIHHAATGDGAP